jgi:hypothetical protein
MVREGFTVQHLIIDVGNLYQKLLAHTQSAHKLELHSGIRVWFC